MTKNQLVPVSAKKHNGIISFWKFCFCMLIIIFHGNVFAANSGEALFSKGSIGVEFFFLVSGFLLSKTAFRRNEQEPNTENLGKETFHFIWKKYLFFLPYVFFAGLLDLILQNVCGNIDLSQNVLSILDMLLLRMTGLKVNVIIGQVWYISAMLLSMMILYPLLRKYKKNYLYLVAPLVILLGFGWLVHSNGSLRTPEKWLGFAYKGLIRGFLELNLGCILYLLCQKLKNITFTKTGKIFITLIEVGGFILPFLTSQFLSSTKADIFLLAFLAISTLLAFSEKTLEFNLFNHKIFFWLEKFSLPLYICNILARDIVKDVNLFTSLSYYPRLGIYLVINFVLALICMYFISFLQKLHLVEHLKKLIIKENNNQVTENN